MVKNRPATESGQPVAQGGPRREDHWFPKAMRGARSSAPHASLPGTAARSERPAGEQRHAVGPIALGAVAEVDPGGAGAGGGEDERARDPGRPCLRLPLTVRYSLLGDAPARIELFDLTGRSRASRDLGSPRRRDP